MPFSKFEHARYNKMLNTFIEELRPPANIRHELDIEGELTNQTIEIRESIARWDRSTEKHYRSAAKITYVRTQQCWRLYWMRASGKWEKYDAFYHLEQALEAVKKDQYGCFWG
ncbi:DUF3024 domain-containing protein [uncultured Vibrio sp.]|uniref:DUF3024 domain-containing protein n=1 Tax=uncultured Vibrio sp. TaxID=114054 RepID=UPI00260FCAF3|nr:DUF3024 domain-containing protein [uncultured Vibrio sp.]